MSKGDEQQHEVEAALSGARIVVVEDEYYLAEDLADAVKSAGAEVVGPVGSIGGAQELLEAGGFDGAILDMNLRGEFSFALAMQLQAAGVPFVIVSGYSGGAFPPELIDVPRLEKPTNPANAVDALAEVITGRRQEGRAV